MQKLRSVKMRIDSGYIHLHGLLFHAFHGVMPQERLTGGDFKVDIRIGCDISQAVMTNDITLTPDYAAVYNIVKSEMEKPSQLLEHVAGRIAESIFLDITHAMTIDISVTKLNPPMGACCDGAGVELHLSRINK